MNDVTALLLKNANIPKRYREPVAFNPREHAGWAAAFDQLASKIGLSTSGAVVILCGARGTGKTRMATELIYHATRERNYFCRYEELLEYLDAVRRMNTSEDVATHHELYEYPRLLVLDEIAKAGDSAWAEQRLFKIVNQRYNDLKHTVLITAAPPEALPDLLGPSVHDRIHEGGMVIHLNWPSFRSNAPQRAK